MIGDMKQMDRTYVRGLDIYGYGTSIAIGVGVPIPVLNTEVVERASISDEEIFTNMIDYSVTSKNRPVLGQYSYAQLRSGSIEYEGRKIRTSSLSSYWGARKVASELKDWIERGIRTHTTREDDAQGRQGEGSCCEGVNDMEKKYKIRFSDEDALQESIVYKLVSEYGIEPVVLRAEIEGAEGYC